MPKFHLVCRRTTIQRVVLEVNAPSAHQACLKLEGSLDPESEFNEIGPFDEGLSEITVEMATRAVARVPPKVSIRR